MKALVVASILAFSLTGCKQALPSYAMQINVPGGIGSGTKISADEILTAYHVVSDQTEITIKNERGETSKGVVTYINREYDIAVVKSKISGKIANVTCKEKSVGTPYNNIGNPIGIEFVKSWGAVAGRPREYGNWKSVYVVDGAVIMGQSGAGAFTSSGSLMGVIVGIATAVIPGFVPMLPPSRAPSGFGLVVPSSEICKLLKIDG